MKLKVYIDELKQLTALDRGALDDRLFAQLINEQRAVWLKNEFNQGRSIDDIHKQVFQTSIDLVTSKQIPFFTKGTFTILKTDVKIPTTIDRHYEDTITMVYCPEILAEPFNYISFERAKYAGNGILNKKDIFCFIHNDYMYIKTNNNPKIKMIDLITIEGVFEDPREVFTITNPDEDWVNMEYPISMHVWTYIKNSILGDSQVAVQTDLNEKVQ